MQIAPLFNPLFVLDEAMEPVRFVGSAFPIAPGGGLLTCRHVVDVHLDEGQALGVFDGTVQQFSRIPHSPVLPGDTTLDLAYIPDAFARPREEFFPVLEPAALTIGAEVSSFGYYAFGGGAADLERGYFAGRVVSLSADAQQRTMTLPYAVLEGMSGSPVLTYHHGTKLAGVAIGNRTSRILASEVVEYADDRLEFKESVNRIVEFGVAYHCAVLIDFLREVGVTDFVVSRDRLDMPWLKDS